MSVSTSGVGGVPSVPPPPEAPDAAAQRRAAARGRAETDGDARRDPRTGGTPPPRVDDPGRYGGAPDPSGRAGGMLDAFA